MLPVESPCLNCSDRHMACHSECEKYKTFRSKLDEYNDKLREEKHQRDLFYSSRRDKVDKALKRRRK